MSATVANVWETGAATYEDGCRHLESPRRRHYGSLCVVGTSRIIETIAGDGRSSGRGSEDVRARV